MRYCFFVRFDRFYLEIDGRKSKSIEYFKKLSLKRIKYNFGEKIKFLISWEIAYIISNW